MRRGIDLTSGVNSSEIDFHVAPPDSRNLRRGTEAASSAVLGSDCIDVEELEAEARGAVAIVSSTKARYLLIPVQHPCRAEG